MSHRDAKEPRICFVVTSPAVVNLLGGDGADAMGGAELQLCLLARELRHRNWAVSFLVGDYGQGNIAYSAEGIRLVTGHPGRKLQHRAWGRSYAAWKLWRTLQSIDADIYLSRGLVGQAGVIARFCRLKSREYVFWFGKNADAWYGIRGLSPLPFWERLAASYGIRNADLVIVQTNEQNALLCRYVGRGGLVIPNVAPWQDTSHDNSPAEHVLWVGSIQPKKRPHMILDVASQLPQVQFVMAGGQMPAYPDLYDTVKRRAEHTNNVDFLGFVPFDQIKELFERAGVLISTSEPEQEGFPNVFLQAWSTGTPVVATCDPDEVICRHRLGYHCESTNEMSERIQEITHSHELQKEIGQRTHQYVSEYHSLDSIMGQLDGFLRELIDDKQTAGTNQKRVLE